MRRTLTIEGRRDVDLKAPIPGLAPIPPAPLAPTLAPPEAPTIGGGGVLNYYLC